MSTFTVTVDGLDELVDDLDYAVEEIVPELRKVVARGCVNIKKDWRAAWANLSHAPALPYAIGYDTSIKDDMARGVVGPDKDKRQGALGNLVEYGSVNNPPHPAGSHALATESQKFEDAVAKVASDLLEGRRD